MIVSAYPAIDVAVGHARKAEKNAEGTATVTFQKVNILQT
jgi:hypothetical protein